MIQEGAPIIMGATQDSEGRPVERQVVELREKVLRSSDQREYILAAWDGTNRSGFQPLDDKVLVLMDEHSETTQGGVVIPSHLRDRQNMAAETGVIVAIGPAAFRWNDTHTREWYGRKPAAGDRCYIDRYSGQVLQGQDGRAYRLMSQSCVGAIAVPLEVANVKPRRRLQEPAA